MNLPKGRGDKSSNQSVPDSSSSDKEATSHVHRVEAAAGADGKVKADVDRKAKGGRSVKQRILSPNILVQSANFSPQTQPKLFPRISSHGLRTAADSSWPDPILSTDLSRDLKKKNAARRILMTPRHQNSAPLLQKLHWLPLTERIKYKAACRCFHAVNGSGPAYLSELLPAYSPPR